ncbi:MAG: universal stress protein [Synergistaceae bacterium]|nr:universal stress protein [Synergistaceae bacterium]
MKKVVVAIDGSEASKSVIDYAIHYADRESDADMYFLHVIGLSEHVPMFYGEGTLMIPPSEEDVKKEFGELIRKETEALGKTIPRMSITVRTGKAYDQIVKFAEEIGAAIIMIGHRGLGAMERFFLGSVAAKVVANAPCSVYVHRPAELPKE